ncbi:hypothetical protein KTR9_0048 [Gordonia sp. KTR9]|nr:hypothetical protein KTR9_0048 [Gordonia sp. KTR9]
MTPRFPARYPGQPLTRTSKRRRTWWTPSCGRRSRTTNWHWPCCSTCSRASSNRLRTFVIDVAAVWSLNWNKLPQQTI